SDTSAVTAPRSETIPESSATTVVKWAILSSVALPPMPLRTPLRMTASASTHPSTTSGMTMEELNRKAP
ncbi:hypothetical protein BDQ94DRAFT_137197, partial [Aspergillus welwitschiae]